MKPVLLGTALLLAAIGGGRIAAAQDETATATFIGTDEQEIGTATLTQTPAGVLIEIDLEGVPPGEHGFHIHETGSCQAADGFESAGGHYAPAGNEHGYLSANGPHAGDMPNLFVGEDGVLQAHVLDPGVTLGEGDTTLFDEDGSALVLHAGADDYSSQPSGDAGDRLACAEIAAP